MIFKLSIYYFLLFSAFFALGHKDYDYKLCLMRYYVFFSLAIHGHIDRTFGRVAIFCFFKYLDISCILVFNFIVYVIEIMNFCFILFSNYFFFGLILVVLPKNSHYCCGLLLNISCIEYKHPSYPMSPNSTASSNVGIDDLPIHSNIYDKKWKISWKSVHCFWL